MRDDQSDSGERHGRRPTPEQVAILFRFLVGIKPAPFPIDLALAAFADILPENWRTFELPSGDAGATGGTVTPPT